MGLPPLIPPSVCIISIVRLIALINITQYPSWDGFYSSANMIYWTAVEVNAAIACACIMTLKPLIQRVFPRLLSPSKGIREPTLQWITPVNNDSIHETNHRNSTPAPINPLTRRMSNAPPHTQQHCCGCSCADSNTPINSNSTSGNTLPNPHLYSEHSPIHRHHNHPDHDTIEKSHYYHSFTTMKPSRPDNTVTTLSAIPSSTTPVPTEYDLDHDLDLEAQRTCSPPSTAGCTNNTNTTNNNHNHNHTGGSHSISTTSNSSADGRRPDDEAEEDRPLRAPPRAHLRLDIRVARAVARDSWSRSPASSSPGSGLGSAVGPGPGPSAPGSGRRRSGGWGTTASGSGAEMREVGRER